MQKIFTLIVACMIILSINAQIYNYDIVNISMTNLVVTQQDGFETLEASHPDMGLAVLLNVYPDGKLKDDSQVTQSSRILPIKEGNITSKYDETKHTNIYTGLLVVDMGEDILMGIQLTLYSEDASAIDVTIENAEITITELPDGMGGTYEMLIVSTPWNNDHTLTIECFPKDYEGYLQINETYTIENEEGVKEEIIFWTTQHATITITDDTLTITGKFKVDAIGAIYNVSISGKLPASETPSKLNNIHTYNAPTKYIQNGQLIIVRNGIKYNAIGATR